MTLHNLGVLYAGQDRAPDAQPLLDRAFAIFESSYGPEHPKTRACRDEITLLE
jgi:hypothetical protein